MGDLGVLAAFVIARLCGHLWSRCLRQDVVRCLGFKRIIIVRSDHFAPSCFQALKVGLFFRASFPWSPLWKISENGRFGCDKCRKDTQIAHFLRFSKGGTKGNWPEKQADFKGLKTARRK